MIDFTKIPEKLKSFLINLMLIPFWYIAIYLFHPIFYTNSDLIIIFFMCVGLTIVSSILFAFIHSSIDDEVDVIDTEEILTSTVLRILLLSLLIFGNYMFYIFFGIRLLFYGLLLIYYGFYILALLIILLIKK